MDYEEVKEIIASKLGLKIIRKDYSYLKEKFMKTNIKEAEEIFQKLNSILKLMKKSLLMLLNFDLALKKYCKGE